MQSRSSNRPVEHDDELWFYYSGRSTTHGEKPNIGTIGLGTLRVDGFVSVDADEAGGVLTTKPLRLNNNNLYVNADASTGGIRAEIVDEFGRAISPFSLTNCEAIASDSIRHPLRWRGTSSLASLGDREVQLRFHIRNAKLYAFWTE